MALHQTIRDLVSAHGDGILADAAGFRGVLDDVLDEGAATTGEINLLVDAVRFGATLPLARMIQGGADPARAVDECGARLARDRGGDVASASWATAVLAHARGLVPEAVVLRYRSRPAPSAFAPPTSPPPSAPPAPTPPVPPAPPVPPGPPARRSRTGRLVAGAVVLVLLAGGGVAGGIALTHHKEPRKTDKPKVDPLTPAAINARYSDLAGSITTGTRDCKAATGSDDETATEVLSCVATGGTLTLRTYATLDELKAQRHQRLDRVAGSISHDAGQTAYYSFDPEAADHKAEAAVVYWDNETGLQSATLTGTPGVPIDTLTTSFKATRPLADLPAGPVNPMLVRFLDSFLDPAGCQQHAIYFDDATEEVRCEHEGGGIGVVATRFPRRSLMLDQRQVFARQHDSAEEKGRSGRWRFSGVRSFYKPGAIYAYRSHGRSYVYWDWSERGCNCLALAAYRDDDKGLAKLEAWWRKASKRRDY
ncbi:hypothetical protein [Nocardioides montaniterrae]